MSKAIDAVLLAIITGATMALILKWCPLSVIIVDGGPIEAPQHVEETLGN